MSLQGKALVDKIKELAHPAITSLGLELVGINYYYMANRLVLRIFIDRPEGGVNIDECALVNERLGEMLDVSGILEQSYTLEVSSPGIDWSLKTKEDFKRVRNKELIIFLNESIKGKNEIHGVLKKVDDNFVYIESQDEELEVPYGKITKARQAIE